VVEEADHRLEKGSGKGAGRRFDVAENGVLVCVRAGELSELHLGMKAPEQSRGDLGPSETNRLSTSSSGRVKYASVRLESVRHE
jgi:hypothetical protein